MEKEAFTAMMDSKILQEFRIWCTTNKVKISHKIEELVRKELGRKGK